MSYVCDNCGKGVQYGGTHTHGRGVAGGRWKKKAPSTRKVFKPNLHNWQGMKLCTKCLRKLKTQNSSVKSAGGAYATGATG